MNQGVVLKDWNDLRKTFMSANARKAIAPTQFNHQSTRGHCIMTLEVEKPDPDHDGMKQRGRVYVCDLAGTEPAGDIVYANYQKIQFDDGTIEHKYLGPHSDPSKSKELQDQGKKINLSLTEMAQFFMKMAGMPIYLYIYIYIYIYVGVCVCGVLGRCRINSFS